MANQSLMDRFQKQPQHFLEEFGVVCPGSTTWELTPQETALDGAVTKPALYLHQHLNIAQTPQLISTLKSYQADAKVLRATLDYFSMGGGDGSSGQVVGTTVDHTRTKQKGIEDKVLNVTCAGRAQVQVSIALDGPGFPVYFLPWKSNNTMTMQLGDGARYFFTAAMTGCTVQIAGTPEAPIVSHANAGGEEKKLKVAAMDTMLQEAIRRRLSPAQQLAMHNLPATRLQTGLWGNTGTPNLTEVTYAEDPAGARNKGFEENVAALQRAPSPAPGKVKDGEIEVVDEVDGNAEQLTVTVAGWRPPHSARWEFFYQVWANFTIKRVVYRHEKGMLTGRRKKVLEKTHISDYVILEPGRKFWPGGAGWPDPGSDKLSR